MTNVQNSDLCRLHIKKRECEQITNNFFEIEANPRFRFYFKLANCDFLLQRKLLLLLIHRA